MLSLQASYAAPLILLAQNRQADRDRVALEQDRARDERNLADTEFLTREVAALRIALRDQATRDFVRGELRDLLDEMEERGLVVRRERAERPRRPAPGRRPPARRPRLGPCPTSAPTPSTLRSRRSSTPRSASRSPSSAWSRASPPTRPATSPSPSCSPSPACPLKDTLTKDTTAALSRVEGVTGVTVTLGVMSDEQRGELKTSSCAAASPSARCRSPGPARSPACMPWRPARAASASRRSPPTSPPSLAQQGLRVGVVDADIYGFSIPRMLGVERPADAGRRHDPAAAQPRREGHLDRHVRARATSRSCGAGRCCTARCSSSSPTSSGATSTSSCSTCRRAPATSPSRWPSSSRAPRSSSSPPRSRRPPRSPSGPARSPCRPTSASPASSRTCRWLELPDGSPPGDLRLRRRPGRSPSR